MMTSSNIDAAIRVITLTMLATGSGLGLMLLYIISKEVVSLVDKLNKLH